MDKIKNDQYIAILEECQSPGLELYGLDKQEMFIQHENGSETHLQTDSGIAWI